ncbi:hypothetical protein [Alienimonas sp. DA493]|uniref:type IV pilus modification PilV family protein n=1 Tax=Alienimonas sp. DA493 TaxID=3373605 RepID=UPI003753FCC3
MTLTEVLMSVLVMGIGVTSVATLFPLAVLRGARATQLTAGTILKQNAAETVAFSYSPSLAPPPANIGGVAIGTGAGEVDVSPIVARISTGVSRDAMLLDPDANGSIETFGPGRPDGTPVNDWAGDPVPPRKYIVDPLGAAVLSRNSIDQVTPFLFGAVDTPNAVSTANVIDQFGARISGTIGGRVQRFCWPFPYEALAAAEDPGDADGAAVRNQMIETAYNLVGRAGDYGTEVDTLATVTRREDGDQPYLEVAYPLAEVGSLEDLFAQGTTERPAVGTATARAVLFRPDGRGSAAIPLLRLHGQKAMDIVTEDGNFARVKVALPNNEFLAAAGLTDTDDAAVLRVRLERPDRKYSWMLTCRRTGTDRLETEVAVFFNRALSAEDESVWRCQPVVNDRGRIESYVLFWDPTAGQSPPNVSGGARLLEMSVLKWLSVGALTVSEGDAADAPVAPPDDTTTGRKYLQFALSSETPFFNEASVTGEMFCAFPRGVVDVYPLSPPGAIRK